VTGLKDAVRANFDASVSAYEAYERRTGRFGSLAELLHAEMATHVEGTLDTVLDAGAGTGISTAVFADAGSRTVALDVSRGMLRANDAADRVQGDFDRLPLPDDSFDGVAFTASLFLVTGPTVAVREAMRVCRPGGVVGAVAPLGWVDADGRDAFAGLDRDSRSPAGADEVEAAVAGTFADGTTTVGTWRFATTAEDLVRFHTIPAMAARLYPTDPPEERVRKATDLLASLEGTFEQRWRWVVGVAEGSTG
jgi:cyclopropane-fatty-acyl-phospholipid synthase